MMTPQQKIKWYILKSYQDWAIDHFGDTNNAIINEHLAADDIVDVDELYDYYFDIGILGDFLYEFREGEVETNIAAEQSGSYESKSVASLMPDGSWVGWTYWYGGGKHGNPEEIEWFDDVYDLSCVVEERMVIIRTFTKV